MAKDTVIELLRRHVEASLERDAYAARAIDLFAKGEDEAGEAAAEMAELWDLRAKALEQ